MHFINLALMEAIESLMCSLPPAKQAKRCRKGLWSDETKVELFSLHESVCVPQSHHLHCETWCCGVASLQQGQGSWKMNGTKYKYERKLRLSCQRIVLSKDSF
ncbi:hypothetical protein ILYODFUR_010675 [Ilyodon furcidens]|uniref:Uncharacterized protein n=1 Tax=Ilyodon furcidens TaxID=33524 RepID=A0ABV0SW90_9TELE